MAVNKTGGEGQVASRSSNKHKRLGYSHVSRDFALISHRPERLCYSICSHVY